MLTRVFGVGVHRTGTSSLMRALQRLGYRTTHWKRRAEVMDDIARGIYRLSIMDRFDAISDFPIPCFYEELARAFPDAKFILTVRDEAGWLRSVGRHTAGRRLEAEEQLFYAREDFDAADFVAKFRRHNDAVRHYFAGRDNFLVMDIPNGDGWGTLYPFVAPTAPIPSDDFPRLSAQF